MTDKQLIKIYAQDAIKELEKLIAHNENMDGGDVLWAQMNFLREKMKEVLNEHNAYLVRPGKNKSYKDEVYLGASRLKSALRDVDKWIKHGTEHFIPEGVCPNVPCLHYPNDKKHREECQGRPGWKSHPDNL